MHKFFFRKIKLFYIILILSGCSPTFESIPLETQNRLSGLPIKEAENRLGAPSSINITTSGKKYSWMHSGTIWKNTSPSRKFAGTRMVNGHNVSSIVNIPPIQTLQTTTCSLDIMTDKHDLITGVILNGNGDCYEFVNKL